MPTDQTGKARAKSTQEILLSEVGGVVGVASRKANPHFPGQGMSRGAGAASPTEK